MADRATSKKKTSTTSKKTTPKKKAPAKSRKTAKKKAPAKKGAVTKKKVAKKAASNSEPRRGYCNSQQELADFLNCSRSKINRLQRKEGSPKKTADGKYPMVEWKEFAEKHDKDFSEKDVELELERKAKREIQEIKLAKEKLELEEMMGNVMHIDDVCKVLSQAFSGMTQALKDSEHKISPLVAGLDVPEARSVIRANHIDALQRFSLGDWAKKKPFWRKVYAQLRDLQAIYSPGNGQSET